MTDKTNIKITRPKIYKWVIEIRVIPEWVADGFDLSDPEVAHDQVRKMIPRATGSEIGVRVIKTPDPELIRKEQNGEFDEEDY